MYLQRASSWLAPRRQIPNVFISPCACVYVFVCTQCCDELNHGVLIVGYGTEQDGTPYWREWEGWAPSTLVCMSA